MKPTSLEVTLYEALRELQHAIYKLEFCPDKNCAVCKRNTAVQQRANDAILAYARKFEE